MNKKQWGNIIWELVHVFIENIIPEKFQNDRKAICSQLYEICTNLPCSYCSNHAKTYLKQKRLFAVTSKEQLKAFFYEFHNNVNIRTKKRPENKEILNSYTEKLLKPRIMEYINAMLSTGKNNMNMMSFNFSKKRLINDKIQWFKQNKDKFWNFEEFDKYLLIKTPSTIHTIIEEDESEKANESGDENIMENTVLEETDLHDNTK